MKTNPRKLLREFYSRALLSPELLCLSCAHSAWNRPGGRCSEQTRQDCHLFVSDMVNHLALGSPQRPSRPGAGLSP